MHGLNKKMTKPCLGRFCYVFISLLRVFLLKNGISLTHINVVIYTYICVICLNYVYDRTTQIRVIFHDKNVQFYDF